MNEGVTSCHMASKRVFSNNKAQYLGRRWEEGCHGLVVLSCPFLEADPVPKLDLLVRISQEDKGVTCPEGKRA